VIRKGGKYIAGPRQFDTHADKGSKEQQSPKPEPLHQTCHAA